MCIRDRSCFAGTSGSLFATATGGSGIYEYSLNGSPFSIIDSFTGLAAGSYTVTVRNAGNPSCTSVCNITITEPPVLDCSTTTMPATCNGAADGQATVIGTGGNPGYTYLWNTSPAQTTATAVMLSAGTWTVIVTDANGCTTQCSAIVTEPTEVVCSLTGTDISCNGGADGTIATAPSGGTAPYELSLIHI